MTDTATSEYTGEFPLADATKAHRLPAVTG